MAMPEFLHLSTKPKYRSLRRGGACCHGDVGLPVLLLVGGGQVHAGGGRGHGVGGGACDLGL